MDEVTHSPGETFIDLDVIRRCMLRGNITLDIDALVTNSPVDRCKTIARFVFKASQHSREVSSLVESSGIMDQIKREAYRRQGGVFPPALTVKGVDRQKETHFG